MQNGNSNNTFPGDERWQVWLRQAKYDLAAAFLSLENEYYEWAAYQAEQSVEKSLKAVIVHAGAHAPKIHKLGILFGFCNQINPDFKDTKFNFKHIESFTFISRYPFLLPDKNHAPHELITEGAANQALVEASEVVLKITKLLKKTGAKALLAIPEMKVEVYSPAMIAKRAKEMTQSLVKLLDPDTIILFGSFARNWGKPTSGTMDILIIASCKDLPFVERIFRARDASRGHLPIIEPLVYTPEEVMLLRQEDEFFLQSAFAEGKVLYQKEKKSTL